MLLKIAKLSKLGIIIEAILVGILSGIIVILFNWCISNLFSFNQSFLSQIPLIAKIFVFPIITCLAGLIVGILVFKVAPETKGSGIPFVKLALMRLGKKIRIRSMFIKFAAGVIGIGSGFSLGREGPSVQLGAGCGAVISRLFKKNGTKQHNLITAGAASAIGATFNAPVAGTIFAVEELTRKFSVSTLFTVLIATVSAVTVSRHFVGENPSFFIPELQNLPKISLESLVVFIVLGIIVGVFGVLFAKTIFLNQKVFDKIKVPNYIKPAIAGFVIGIVGVFLPYVLGSGNIFISQLFQYKFTLSLIAIIFAVKFLVTPLCFSSGAAGGIFFPVLMLGSFLGYIVGSISNVIGIEINLVTISIVGMGAFLAAVARTPITAIVMVFELTGDYHHILPVMLSIAVADLVAQLFGHEPIYSTLILKQSQNTKEKETLCELKVVDAMDKNVVNVTLKTKISEIPNLMKQTKYNVLPILNDNNVVAGSISKEEIDDYIFSNKNTDDSIENIMNPEPVTVNQKENLYKALFVLHTNEILDVIVVDDTNKLAGILCRKQIVFEDRFSDIIV